MFKSRTTEYRTWIHIKGRCFNKNHARYADYGGRGITMCDEWKNSFDAFLDYVGRRPDGLTLDRIDNDGNYAPGNVRWASYSQQSLNRRVFKNNKLGIRGVRIWKNKYKVVVNYPSKDIYLGLYKTLEEAIAVRDRHYLKHRNLTNG